jgi:hypothetical protein
MPVMFIAFTALNFNADAQYQDDSNFEKAFEAGEELLYTIKVGIIHGGDASLKLKKTTLDNKTVFHAVGEARTIGVTNAVFNVVDIYESYFDINTGLPYKSIRNIKEGGYKRYQEAYFNHEKNTAYSQRLDSVIQTPAGILDMISVVYYLRILDLSHLKKGDIINTVTFFDDEVFPFALRYKGKEEVKTKFGTLKCLRFDPVVETGRIFKSEDDMSFWSSDDANLIPVKVRFDMVLVSLRLELDNYSNLKYPLAFLR